MQRYKVLRELGDGAFGSVSLATHGPTGDKVAIKRMKKRFATWDECVNLREVKSLKKLVHPNIVRLREVIRDQTDQRLYFVFEYCESNLLNIIRERTGPPLPNGEVAPPSGGSPGFSEIETRWITFQMLLGLAYMHKYGYFHRDLKPENLLVSPSPAPLTVKLADFGLARELRSRPPYTEYISTRWYRAPEVLLRSTSYSSPIDMWAVGCILAELVTLKPLFPGSSEIDQLFRIANVLGSPTNPAVWREGARLAASINLKIPTSPQTTATMSSMVPQASADALALLSAFIAYEPSRRPSATQALSHPYFTSARDFSSIRIDADFCITAGRLELGSKWYQVRQLPDNVDAVQASVDGINGAAARLNDGPAGTSLAISTIMSPPRPPLPLAGVHGHPATIHDRTSTTVTMPVGGGGGGAGQHITFMSQTNIDALLDDLDPGSPTVPQYLPALPPPPPVNAAMRKRSGGQPIPLALSTSLPSSVGFSPTRGGSRNVNGSQGGGLTGLLSKMGKSAAVHLQQPKGVPSNADYWRAAGGLAGTSSTHVQHSISPPPLPPNAPRHHHQHIPQQQHQQQQQQNTSVVRAAAALYDVDDELDALLRDSGHSPPPPHPGALHLPPLTLNHPPGAGGPADVGNGAVAALPTRPAARTEMPTLTRGVVAASVDQMPMATKPVPPPNPGPNFDRKQSGKVSGFRRFWQR